MRHKNVTKEKLQITFSHISFFQHFHFPFQHLYHIYMKLYY